MQILREVDWQSAAVDLRSTLRRQTDGEKAEVFIKHCILTVGCAIWPVAGACASVQLFIGELGGASASPPTPSPATGLAYLAYSPGITSLEVQVSFVGLIAPAAAAHIHCCIVSPATTAGVAVTFPGFPAATSGSYDHFFDLSAVATYNAAFITAHSDVSGAQNALLQGMANHTAYLDIHTSVYPSGEIRANLVLDTLFANGFE